ncbi:MAG: imidazolonepropionase [Phycisphaerales bacterium]|nr:imidazolonepropionase [Phycisphaerales bacterium]
MSVVFRNARVLTLAGPDGPKRGSALGELAVLPRGRVETEGDRIVSVGPEDGSNPPPGRRQIDAGGRVLMPGFVDCHTHALWAGDRLDEWRMKLAGARYLDILKAGGGIMSTVRAVRAADEAELIASLRRRLVVMAREGTTTVEVKSGYGFDTANELKMLSVIESVRAGGGTLPTVIPTALLGHGVDPDVPGFVDLTIGPTLDAVHDRYPGITLDAFCEDGAWSPADCARLFERGLALGHRFRIHADQFNELGALRWAFEHGAVSVDHLEATSPDHLARLARSGTFGVMLPCTGFHTDGRYADGRRFVDAGGALALASNCNPGSSPCGNMPMTIGLAVRKLGLTPAEAIAAATVNPAQLLGLTDRGTIGAGRRADLILLRHTDERQLAYEFGGNPVDLVMLGGALVE